MDVEKYKYELHNSNFKSRVEKFLVRQHFMKLVGINLDLIEEGTIEGSLKLSQDHLQQTGLVHGGVIATMADIVAGFAAYTLLPADFHVVTAELKVSYLNPGRGEALYAKGWVLKQGYKINFCEAEVYAVQNDKKTLIAKCTTAMATIFPQELNNNKVK